VGRSTSMIFDYLLPLFSIFLSFSFVYFRYGALGKRNACEHISRERERAGGGGGGAYCLIRLYNFWSCARKYEHVWITQKCKLQLHKHMYVCMYACTGIKLNNSMNILYSSNFYFPFSFKKIKNILF